MILFNIFDIDDAKNTSYDSLFLWMPMNFPLFLKNSITFLFCRHPITGSYFEVRPHDVSSLSELIGNPCLCHIKQVIS